MRKLLDRIMNTLNNIGKQKELLLSPKSVHGRTPLKVDEAGLDLICKFEGFDSHVYEDENGYKTIGYGHKLQPYENFTTISEDQAKALLLTDIVMAEKAVNNDVQIELNQNQFNACVSFCYNIGVGNFKNSTFLKLLNENKIQEAASELLRWDHIAGHESVGLLTRRQTESVLLNRI